MSAIRVLVTATQELAGNPGRAGVHRNYFVRSVFGALIVISGGATLAQGSPSPVVLPTEVKIVTVPNTEVKPVSAPAMMPAEVKIISAPESSSEHALVTATWWLLAANMLLCLITSLLGWKQSRDMRSSIQVSQSAAAAATISADAADRSANAASESVNVTKRQERAALEREVNRAAHKVIATATRLEQLALQVPVAREHLHVLCGQGGMPEQVKKQTEETLRERRKRMQEISSYAHSIASSSLAVLLENELTERLWRVDEHEVQLDVIRESITAELNGYETESMTRRQQQTLMHAGMLAGRPPPSSKLGG